MPYLTPDSPPDDTRCFRLSVPNDITWIGIVKGALSELIKAYNFEKFGSATPEETAGRFLQMYDEFVFEVCDMACCYDIVQHRTTVDGQMQISTDGGTTWSQDNNDPRQVLQQMPPPVPAGVSATDCDAASNGKQHLEDIILGASEAFTNFNTVLGFVGAVALLLLACLFAPEAIPVLIPVLFAAASAIFSLGKTAFDAYWTTDEKDKLLCALACNISSDGSFTDAGFNAVVGDLTALLTAGAPKDWMIAQIKAMGRVGLSNLCSYGQSANSDCSSCNCPKCPLDLDLTVTCPTPGMTILEGACSSGNGIEVNHPRPPFGDFFVKVEYVFNQPCNAKYWHFDIFFTTGHANNQWWIDHAYERDGNGDLVWVDGSGAMFGAPNGLSHAGGIFTPDVNPVPSLAFRINGWDGGYQTGGAYIQKIMLNDTAP